MKLIGITGGIGAGKSALLDYIGDHYNCRIILADEAAHLVQQPGKTSCYDSLVMLLGRQVLAENGQIDKQKMAERIFSDATLLKQVNQIIHPAVKAYILGQVAKSRQEGKLDFFFIEAALLIEDGYADIVDELWYIHAEAGIRRERLKAARQYSDDKIDRIMASQLPEEEFRKQSQVVIDNSTTQEAAFRQIDKRLGAML